LFSPIAQKNIKKGVNSRIAKVWMQKLTPKGFQQTFSFSVATTLAHHTAAMRHGDGAVHINM
jgi:hypothetical protein